MSLAVVTITLLAAVLHATWNAIAHGVRDRLVGFGLIGLSYVVVGGLGALALGPPPAAAWPAVLVSAGFHIGYTLLLAASYQLGEFSQVYPVARGTAPWVVALFEVVVGGGLPWWQLVGVGVISLGLVSLALDAGRAAQRSRTIEPGRAAQRSRTIEPGRSTWASMPGLGTAVATGLFIAGYTIVDAGAVATTPVPVYASWMFLVQGPVLPLLAVARRGRGLLRVPWRSLVVGFTGGLVSLVAYGLVLVAQTSGATAAVAALRETSIVIGAIIGTVFLGERFGWRRVAAAAVVLVGIVLVDL